MNWNNTRYTEGTNREFLEENLEKIQEFLNQGYGHSNISRELGVNYYVVAAFIEEHGMIAWPELDDLERVTFVDFVKGRIQFDGKTRMITKQTTIPHVIMSAEDYARYHLLLCQMMTLKKGMDDTSGMIEEIHPVLEKSIINNSE